MVSGQTGVRVMLLTGLVWAGRGLNCCSGRLVVRLAGQWAHLS